MTPGWIAGGLEGLLGVGLLGPLGALQGLAVLTWNCRLFAGTFQHTVVWRAELLPSLSENVAPSGSAWMLAKCPWFWRMFA